MISVTALGVLTVGHRTQRISVRPLVTRNAEPRFMGFACYYTADGQSITRLLIGTFGKNSLPTAREIESPISLGCKMRIVQIKVTRGFPAA